MFPWHSFGAPRESLVFPLKNTKHTWDIAPYCLAFRLLQTLGTPRDTTHFTAFETEDARACIFYKSRLGFQLESTASNILIEIEK